jgi:DNA-binding beta-propeller fold protein YncE
MKKNLLPTLLSLVTASAVCAGEYHLLKEIPVGGDGGWDYLSVDSVGQRLYVSHGTKVAVIDIAKDMVAGEITNTPGVHGLAPAPDLARGFVSCGREDKCAIVDLKTLQIISKVDTGKNPDAMLYDPARQEVYMFNHTGGSATVIDAKAGKVIATVPLDGKVEFGAVDTKAERVFVNLEDKSELVAIDTKTHTVKKRWPIAPGEEASGLAFDEKNHRLFLGCGGSKTMVMMDSESGKVLASVPIGDGVDANSFDPATQLAFASCGDGTVTIAKEEGDKLTVVQTLKTEKGARTMTIDPATHKIYLASAKFSEPAAGQRRGKMQPGSFKVLVYGQE